MLSFFAAIIEQLFLSWLRKRNQKKTAQAVANAPENRAELEDTLEKGDL